MANSTSRRQLIAQLGMGIAAGLATPYVVSGRQIQSDDKSLGKSELGKKHGNYVAASRFSGQLGNYQILNRVVNMSSAAVKFDYRAAFLIDWVPKQEAVDDEGSSLLVRPVSSALVPGVEDELGIYAIDGSQVVKTTGDAYLPVSRIVKWGEEGFPKGVDWLLDVAEKANPIIKIVKILRRSPEIRLISSLRLLGKDKFAYEYKIENGSDQRIYFEWTSVLRPNTKNGWQDSVDRREESRPYGFEENGPPVLVNDVVAFNSLDRSALPTLINLKAETRLAARGKDLGQVPKKDQNSIMLAPAMIPERWIKN